MTSPPSREPEIRHRPAELKVLHVIEALGLGGAERLLATMLPILREQGIESEVLTLGSVNALGPVLASEGIPVHIGGLPSYRPGPGPVRLVRERLAEGRYDLVHTHLTYANLYGRAGARWARVPATSTFHSCDYEPSARTDNPDFSVFKQRAFQAAERCTIGPAQRFVAVSQCVRDSVSRRLGVAPGRIDVIYNGVPRQTVEEVSPEARLEARQALGLRADGRVVLQVGRLSSQKGQLHTIRAARLSKERLPDVEWVFVGDGSLRERLERERDEAGLADRMRFAGSRHDVRPYLRAADVFLFPSLYEGLGIAALEAMAFGLPVVAYDAGPIPEVVVHGETGLLVPTGDCAELADAVESVLSGGDRSRAMGAAGRRRVLDVFLIDRAAQRHADFYRRLLVSRLS